MKGGPALVSEYVELDGIWHVVDHWTVDLETAVAHCGARRDGQPRTERWTWTPSPLCTRCEPTLTALRQLHDAPAEIIDKLYGDE